MSLDTNKTDDPLSPVENDKIGLFLPEFSAVRADHFDGLIVKFNEDTFAVHLIRRVHAAGISEQYNAWNPRIAADLPIRPRRNG